MLPICIDIETIAAQEQTQEQRQVASKVCSGPRGIRDPSLSPYAGQIICIGVGIEDRIATIASIPEKDILEAFWLLMQQKAIDPLFITFNGMEFDIPFIKVRSGIFGIQATVDIPDWGNYNNKHFDVMEVLTHHRKWRYLSLKDCCLAHGIPYKDTVDGSMIGVLWQSGNIRAIEEHCAEDVRCTMSLFDKIRDSHIIRRGRI